MDPIQRAARICVFFGVLDAVFGGLCFAFMRGEDANGVSGAMLGNILIAEGVLLCGLGYGISRESRTCALIAASLSTLSCFMVFRAGNVIFTMVGGAIALAMWKGFYEINELESRVQQAAEREKELARKQAELDQQARRFGGGDRPSGRVGSTRPSGRFESQPVTVPAGPKMVCPNCQKGYPLGTAQCAACKVATFQD